MSVAYEMPILNLRAVVRETGVQPHTLRAWERRYGLPEPARASSGWRLYSRRDVETIRWLVARLAEGLSIRQAVALWRRIEGEGQDPLQVMPLAVSLPPVVVGVLAELRRAWLEACLRFHEEEANQVLAQAFALHPPEAVCLEVLLAGLREIGERWYAGRATVQHEHFASSLAMHRMGALLVAAPSSSPTPAILVTCPPSEVHTFNLLLLTYLLRRRGWRVVYLGANTPLERIEETVQAVAPAWVVSAAQCFPAAEGVLHLARALAQRGIPFAFGGLVFNRLPALRARIPGHFLAERLEEAVERLEALIHNPQPIPEPPPFPPGFDGALRAFWVRETVIRGWAWQALEEEGRADDRLISFGREFGLHLRAALALGEMGLMEAYLDWVRGCRHMAWLSEETLRCYLVRYAEAVRQWMGDAGRPVADWLGVLANQGG